MDPDRLALLADMIVESRRTRRLIEPLSERYELSLGDAYAIQDLVASARFTDNDPLIGWKLGYTSQAMREQMQVDEPNFGPLYASMLLHAPSRTTTPLLQPRVEPEIGIRLSCPVTEPVRLEELRGELTSVHACLEVVDSIFRNYRFNLVDNTADLSSAALVIEGPELPIDLDLREVSVEISKNGGSPARAQGDAASGDPLLGVVWLSHQLQLQGRRIDPGQLIITGGLTRAFPLELGDRVVARFDEGYDVSVTRRDWDHVEADLG